MEIWRKIGRYGDSNGDMEGDREIWKEIAMEIWREIGRYGGR